MRQALPGFCSPLSAEELAGLACETGVEARLVLEKDGARPWEARHGPFDEDDFAALPKTHWTLLVQDVDKHVPSVSRLLEPFRFIPDWRVDDIMISYAADQGSVGPHIDDYDVFLVQAQGLRRWRIHTQPVSKNEFITGLDLRILPNFAAEYDWILEPGDLLYLPPNCAHWGTAQGDCMTYSVGYRAPELRELARDWMETLIERVIPPGRYRDPELLAQTDSGEIHPRVFERIQELLNGLRDTDAGSLRPWLGRFLTETKDNLHPQVPDTPLDPVDFIVELERRAVLIRSGYARMAFCHGSNGQDHLFVNGKDFALAAGNTGFLRAITQERQLHYGYLIEWLRNPECMDLLCRLHNHGFFEFPR
jgi:50S ribosomal protein L16 3-hydroxylase